MELIKQNWSTISATLSAGGWRPLAVSVRRATELTGLGRSTLYELMAAGELPYVLVRGRRLLIVDDLAALLQRLRSGPSR